MKKYFLIAAAALTTLVACKKEKEDNNPSQPGSAKILKRIIETKDGSTTTYSFSYDPNKRLSSVSSADNSEVTSFTYGDNGNVTKIENKEGGERNVFEITYANGIPVSGTYKSFEKNGPNETLAGQYSLAYTVENNMVTKIKMVVPAEPGTDDQDYEIDYNLSYTNGNLTTVEALGVLSYTASFTYGTKKPAFPAILKYVLDPAGFSLQFFSKNELLTMNYNYPGTELDDTVTTTYTYDSDGYVLTSDDGETQTKFEYQ